MSKLWQNHEDVFPGKIQLLLNLQMLVHTKINESTLIEQYGCTVTPYFLFSFNCNKSAHAEMSCLLYCS